MTIPLDGKISNGFDHGWLGIVTPKKYTYLKWTQITFLSWVYSSKIIQVNKLGNKHGQSLDATWTYDPRTMWTERINIQYISGILMDNIYSILGWRDECSENGTQTTRKPGVYWSWTANWGGDATSPVTWHGTSIRSRFPQFCFHTKLKWAMLGMIFIFNAISYDHIWPPSPIQYY